MRITDTERLDWLIANSCTWNPRTSSYVNSMAKDFGIADADRPRRWSGGYWDDGHPNYGGGGDQITPEAEDDNPRTAIDLAIEKERRESGTATFEAAATPEPLKQIG
jgi:hypothetical protein